MEGAFRDRRLLSRIAATLLALALIADRTAGRSFPVRFLVHAIFSRAEAMARAFVAREIGADGPDVPCLAEPLALRGGAADVELLALRLRMLAAVIGVLADMDGCSGDRPASWAPCRDRGAPGQADRVPLLLFHDRRRGSCRSPPLSGVRNGPGCGRNADCLAFRATDAVNPEGEREGTRHRRNSAILCRLSAPHRASRRAGTGRSASWRRLSLGQRPGQCTAAYMIFCSVASSAPISSTILPCRATRMRSDSAMISGR